MSSVLHISPQLPPAFDGVGDYCAHLRQHWPDSTTQWQFAALHGAEKTQAAWPGVPVYALQPNARSLARVLAESGAPLVVLHYVGYGFQPKGIPLWLPSGLARWRAGGGHLVTMFHEMYAESSPLRSPFWVRPWARGIIRQLVALSDAWVTSCDKYYKWLVTDFNAKPDRGTRIAIGPNIPAAIELEDQRLWPFRFGRKLRVALFGLPNTRLRALERHHRFLGALVSAGLTESVLVIGKSGDSQRQEARFNSYKRLVGGEWQGAFDLPPAQVAEALAKCDIGLVANDPGTLTKSGVFAALATNGVVCVVSNSQAAPILPPFNNCVLLNDDDPAHFETLISEVRGNDQMTARRRLTLRSAASELSWPGIAAAWQQVLASIPERNASHRENVEVKPNIPVLEHRGASA